MGALMGSFVWDYHMCENGLINPDQQAPTFCVNDLSKLSVICTFTPLENAGVLGALLKKMLSGDDRCDGWIKR